MQLCIGVDGCKGGWIAVSRQDDEVPRVTVFATFDGLAAQHADAAAIAVDMPMGLPERTGPGGRGPEMLVRRHLADRQSSVFSIPSRSAVQAEPGPFADAGAWKDAHRRACAVARATSDPPRGVSIQAFGLFAKIRELDAFLRKHPERRDGIIESHPEAAFWRLNAENAMSLPKKIRGRVNPSDMTERRALLARCGIPSSVLARAAPRGAGEDDFLDACAMLLVAERRARGVAVPMPDPPAVDGHGIAIAIWT